MIQSQKRFINRTWFQIFLEWDFSRNLEIMWSIVGIRMAWGIFLVLMEESRDTVCLECWDSPDSDVLSEFLNAIEEPMGWSVKMYAKSYQVTLGFFFFLRYNWQNKLHIKCLSDRFRCVTPWTHHHSEHPSYTQRFPLHNSSCFSPSPQ